MHMGRVREGLPEKRIQLRPVS
nr:unnamed protein product [Callosobruchus chinensis]